MALNPWFSNYTHTGTQGLIEDLVIESIKVYGQDMRYLPRTLVDEDKIFGEDRHSEFNAASQIEMYVRNIESFEGEGDFLSRFDVEIRDNVTFTVARKRWIQHRTEGMLLEEGWTMLAEDGSRILLESGNADGYNITSSRPMEGDLIYWGLVDKLFEIKFVEHEQVFYQGGALQTYDLRCELFEYNNEDLDTGVPAIDVIETENTLNILNFEILQEDGNRMLQENGDSILLEFGHANTAPNATGDHIETETVGLIDFSESNPFAEDF